VPRVVRLRHRVWELLDPTDGGADRWQRAFDVGLLTLIMINVVAAILGTVAEVAMRWATLLGWIERVSVAIFTIEYLLRVWACTTVTRYEHPVWGRLRYLRSPLAVVDLVAIAPFYVPAMALDLRTIRVLRLIRIARLAKTARYLTTLALFRDVYRAKRDEILVTTGLLLALIVCAATVMFYAEGDAQPDKFTSIPAAMWWAVVTLTSVGYGDIYPVTSLGKLLGGLLAVAGIGLVALPTAILGAGFVEALAARRAPPTCSHCGHVQRP
jgi:voltage-gated potassium channel